MELRWIAGQPLLAISRADRTDIRDATTLAPFAPTQASLVAAAASLVPDARIERVERLTAPDGYWYEVGELPRLPVLRVEYADAARTWVHIDPASGAILGDLDARRRLYRWLFDLLHKWDLNLLTLHRPAWDLLLWLLSAAGVITSVSGTWIGWKRLRRNRSLSPAGRGLG